MLLSVIMLVLLCANVRVIFVIINNALQLECVCCLQAEVAKRVDEQTELSDRVANLKSSIQSVSFP